MSLDTSPRLTPAPPPADVPLSIAERIQGRLGRSLRLLPERAKLMIARGGPQVVENDQLDPGLQMAFAIRRMQGEDGLTRGGTDTPANVRERTRREARVFAGAPTPVPAVHDVVVDGADGPLRARHYMPAPRAATPLLVYLHGGGWVIGDVDSHDEPCRIFCRFGGVHVLSIDYRLAPEHPFPAGVDDARAALSWAMTHAAELGADPQRVAIGGDSAGGNIGAAVSQLAAADGGPAPTLQLLIYPSVDHTARRRSEDLFGENMLLTNADREWFNGHYTRSPDDLTDPRCSPLLAGSLSDLAPAIVVTAAHDLLRDEGEEYAAALRQADVPVAMWRAPGMAHGFINLTGANTAAREATIVIAGMLRAGLGV